MSLLNTTLQAVLSRADYIDVLLAALKPIIQPGDVVPLLEGIKTISEEKFAKSVEVVINNNYGGFGLSPAATALMEKLNPHYREVEIFQCGDIISRSDHNLVFVVKKLGKRAFDEFSDLRVETMNIYPGDNSFIHEYDGREKIERIPLVENTPVVELHPQAEIIYENFVTHELSNFPSPQRLVND